MILDMGVTNRDASILTQKNRGVAEYSYYQQWQTATMSNANAKAGVSAPARTSAEVIGEIYIGNAANIAFLGQDRNTATTFNPSSGGAGRSF
jgi:hypothetical protein